MISVSTVRRWAAASNERAVANARTATTDCSRRRLERVEVELYLAQSTSEVAGGVAATSR